MKKTFFLSTVALLSLGALTGCNGGGSEKEIKVWCDQNQLDVTKAQLDAFASAHQDYGLTFNVQPVGEGAAAGNMISDPSSGADIYFFAQDQLSRLVTAKAITQLEDSTAAAVAAATDEAAIAAAKVDNKVYAYPLTSNTYFMFYDTSVVANAHLGTFEAIIDDVVGAGKKLAFNISNSFYNAAVFNGVGAKSEWTTNANGKFIDYDDTYKTKGMPAMKALRTLASLGNNLLTGDDAAASAFSKGAAVVVSGTWDTKTAKELLGDKFGAAPLPKFTVDATQYNLKPFLGYKLVGTKPQKSVERAKIVEEIALYLTNDNAQQTRFDTFGWVPTSKSLLNTDAVKNDPVVKACAAQVETSTLQGQYPGDWWSYADALGKNLSSSTTDAKLQEMLDLYDEQIAGLLS